MNCEFQITEAGATCIHCDQPALPFLLPIFRECRRHGPTPLAPLDYTTAELPCQYRFEISQDNVGTCDQCGPLKGSPFTIYGCTVHTHCSLAQRHSGVKACCRCNDSPQKTEWPEHLR